MSLCAEGLGFAYKSRIPDTGGPLAIKKKTTWFCRPMAEVLLGASTDFKRQIFNVVMKAPSQNPKTDA